MGYATYEWFLKQDFSAFGGKWIAIVNKTVVSSGKNVQKVIQAARKSHSEKRPFVAKIRNTLSIL